MAATGSAPLARAITTIRVVFEGHELPNDVRDLMAAIDVAWVADKPRAVLNRRLAKLRQARRNIFRDLGIWLRSPEVKSTARASGAYWALLEWRRAAVQMHRGEKAHAAFGMNEGGRPPYRGFTRADDAAIYALHSIDLNPALPREAAIKDAATIYKARTDETVKAIPMAESIGREARAKAVQDSKSKRS
jgi:hypothetical protein